MLLFVKNTLYHRLPNKNDTLMIVGFQAAGTRGRKIIYGEKTVKIFGQLVPVNCNVAVLQGLSAHADKVELMDWLTKFDEKPKMTFVIHGEPESANRLKQTIESDLGWNVTVPNYLESFELFSGI